MKYETVMERILIIKNELLWSSLLERTRIIKFLEYPYLNLSRHYKAHRANNIAL